LVLGLVVAAVTVRPTGWDVTSLPRVAEHTPLARVAQTVDPGFHLVRPGYDGQFYWAIAIDPVATNDAHAAVDKPSYRYGHPLLGWLGWLFSAGQGRVAAAVLLALGLLSLAAAAGAASALGGFRASLFVACNAGLLYAAVHSLAEPLAAALLLGVLLARRRPLVAAALCVFLPLTREQLVVVPLILAAFYRRSALTYLASIVPAVVWWIVMRIHLGAWFTSGGSALGAPLAGWKRSLLDNGVFAATGDAREATVVVLVALGGLLLVATVQAARSRRPVDVIFLVLLVVTACLAPNATVILRDALRNTALLVVLVPFVLAQDARPRRTSASVASSTRSTGV